MSTTRTTTGTRRTAVQRALSNMRASARKTLEPLLKTATQDAVMSLEWDLGLSSAVKSSVRNILVGYGAFSHAFFAALEKEMDAAVEDLLNGSESPAKSPRVRGRGLTLVDYDEMEEQTMVDRVAARLRNATDSEYVPLTQRVARATRMPGLGDRENPFHPLRYCRALGVAVEKMEFRGEDRQMVIKAFDAPLQKPLLEVYAALNRKLEEQGVHEAPAPAQRPSAPVQRAVAPARAAPEEGSTGAMEAGVSPPAESPLLRAEHIPADPGTASTAEQLLTALFQRMQVRPLSPAAAAVPAFPPPAGALDETERLAPTTRGLAGTPPSVPLMPPTAVPSPGVFAAAPSILAPAMPTVAAAGAPVSASSAALGAVPVQFATIEPALLASINEVQRLNALATMTGRNVGVGVERVQDERQMRRQVADSATRQIDKLTIELVGLVFDRIHQDPQIPPQIKVALSRLQFPVMKVALADVDLFVSSAQPARRLMDRIASTAVGWHPEGEENERYLGEVNKAINTVLLAINEGPGIFQKALDEFERYLAEERVNADDPVARARRAVEEAEKREAMAINAAVAIRRAIENVQVEPYLREFLLDVWVKVLVAATLREGSEPEFARPYRDAVSDLVWSVQAKSDPEERKRLVKTIPAVLNTLRDGLQLIELPFAQLRPFFKQLMASHALAVKAGETVAAPSEPIDRQAVRRKVEEVRIEEEPAEEPEEPFAVAVQVLHDAMAANQGDVHLLEEPEESAAPEAEMVLDLSDEEIDAMIEGWQRGSWFDLWTGEGVERVRLRWVSPRRHFYLFTSAENGGAHSIAPAILRDYVRKGRIASAEKAPLFQRVVDELLRDLQVEGAPAA